MTDEIESHLLEKYEVIDKLGQGAYGIVWKAIKRKNNRVVAIKKVFDAFHNATDAQRTYREIMILQGLRGHSNITQLLSIVRAKNNKDIYMVFEFMPADLHGAISSSILKAEPCRYIVYQIVKALKFIHSAEIVHRDLKPSNILIDEKCKVQIADFGLARSILQPPKEDAPCLTEYIATRWYRAPEIVLGSQQYSKAVDVWSVGCILGEMMHGEAIFQGKSTLHQVKLILKLIGIPTKEELDSIDNETAWIVVNSLKLGSQTNWDSFFPMACSEALSFIKECLRFSPQDRPTIEELLLHPYLSQYSGREKEIIKKEPIIMKIDEDEKLTIKEYRNALYKDIALKKRQGVIRSLKKDNLKFKKIQNKPSKVKAHSPI